MRLKPIAGPMLAAALAFAAGGSALGADAVGDVLTPVGRNVAVSPLPGVTVTYDIVIEGGITSAELTILAPGDRHTPCGNIIQEFAALPGQEESFAVYLIESSALYTDTIEVMIDHPAADTRLIHTPCIPPEVFSFEEIMTLSIPGDPRGRVPSFSEFVVIQDTRPLGDALDVKGDALVALLAIGSPFILCLDDWMLVDLREIVIFISGSLAENDYTNATLGLHQLKNTVAEWSGIRIPNLPSGPCGNVAGELTSAASTLLFTVTLAGDVPVDVHGERSRVIAGDASTYSDIVVPVRLAS